MASSAAQRCDELIAALGADPAALQQRVEDPARVAAAAGDAQLLSQVASKSLRCAELMAQALEASGQLSKLQRRLAAVAQGEAPEDSDEEDEDVDDEEDERAALLLKDLVAAGAQLEDASKQHAQLGVVDKALHASRDLLASAERDLNDAMVATAGGADSALQAEFRDLYMDEFTSAFGDSLDQFRREEQFESKDVAYLISCIHAGGDIFTPLQKKLFVESIKAAGEQ